MAYVVTDLTMMSHGNACLACLEESKFYCIRPLFNPELYNQITWYEQNGITQGTRLNLTLFKKASSKPHTEDVTCTKMSAIGQLSEHEMQQLLESSCYSVISEGFGTTPIAGEKCFRHDCELPELSIITLKISAENIRLNQDSYKPGRIRATLIDEEDFTLPWISVADLRYVNVSNNDFLTFNKHIKRADVIYVRLGLTRRYPSQQQDGYWLQVNGLYAYK